jgi:hypothetical protein
LNRVLEGSSYGLALRFQRPHRLDELRRHLDAPYRKQTSPKALRRGRQAAQPEHIRKGRALGCRTSGDAKVIPALTPAHPSTALSQIQDDTQTGSFKLIPEDAIHGRNERVRHALKLEGDVVDGQFLGVQRVRRGRCRFSTARDFGRS